MGRILLLMGCFCPGHNRLMNKTEKETKELPTLGSREIQKPGTWQPFLGFLISRFPKVGKTY